MAPPKTADGGALGGSSFGNQGTGSGVGAGSGTGDSSVPAGPNGIGTPGISGAAGGGSVPTTTTGGGTTSPIDAGVVEEDAGALSH